MIKTTPLSELIRSACSGYSGKWLGYTSLAIVLIASGISYASRITDEAPNHDGAQNFRIAYNLAKYGHYSSGEADDPDELVSNMRREPVYPILLALWMRAVVDLSTTDLKCLDEGDRCKEIRKKLKWPQAIFCLLMAALSFQFGTRLSGSLLVGLGSGCFVGLNPWFYGEVDRHYTELLAALLLLIHAYALAGLSRRATLGRWSMAAVSLGLLILTKAAFLYWLVLLIPILLYFGLRRTLSWKPVVFFVIAASLLPALWVTRNALVLEEPALSRRGGSILAIRAQYTTMTWPEYWAAYLYYTPMAKKLAYRVYGEERLSRLDRHNPDGYYQTADDRGVVYGRFRGSDDEFRARYHALQIMLENWPKQIALIPLFAYRSVFRIEDSRRFLVQGVLPAWVFLFGTIAALYLRRKRYLLFASPAWYYIGFYSVFTHFIPRYSLLLLPVMIVCSFWIGGAVVKRLAPAGNERNGSSPG